MSYVQYGNRKIDFEIKQRNRKKTMAIKISPGGEVTVLAPQDLSEDKILAIVQKKAQWIIEKQEAVGRRNFESAKEFVSGEAYPYLGREYRLKVIRKAPGKDERCELVNGRLRVEISQNLIYEAEKRAIKRALRHWYEARAEEKITERVAHYSRQIGTKPFYIQIKNQKRRWGSCSHNGFIRFNWKIIMAPLVVLDYVIVHELCHLLYKHHSFQFWQKVQSVLPDYKRRRKLLRQYSEVLDVL